MSLGNYVAKTRETKAFVKMETSYGVLAMPATTDAIAVLGVPSASQDEQFADSKELLESRSRADRAWLGSGAGKWSLQVYTRPSGSLGVPPVEDVLLEAALGQKTVNAGVSVVYTPALILPSFTLAYREGHTTRFALGCKVGSLKLTEAKKDFSTLDVSGDCQRVLHAGTEETVADSTTTVLVLAAKGAQLFSVGARVEVDGDTNSGAGYEITAVDTAADTITITPALASAPAAGVVVKGCLPVASVAGYTLTGASGRAQVDAVSMAITGVELTVANALSPDEDELSDDGVITGIDEGARQVQALVHARFRRQYASWFQRAHNQVRAALQVTVGSVAGKKIAIGLPLAEANTPSLAGDEYRRTLDLTLLGMPSGTMEDEISITYQ